MIVAEWMPGYGSLFHGANAQTVAEEIMSIGESATPQQIVDKARDKKSELYRCFTWDNDTAAEKWRLQEARSIVTHLIIKRSDEEKDSLPIRRFYKTDKSHDSGYKPVEFIVADKDEYQSLLQQAKAEMIAFKSKYKGLRELEPILEAMDELLIA